MLKGLKKKLGSCSIVVSEIIDTTAGFVFSATLINALLKSDFVGNQLPSIETDFTFDDSEDVIHKEIEKEVSKDVQTAECGGCGADIPVDAKSCQICGSKFE